MDSGFLSQESSEMLIQDQQTVVLEKKTKQINSRLVRVNVLSSKQSRVVLLEQVVLPDLIFIVPLPQALQQCIFNLLPIDDGKPQVIRVNNDSDIQIADVSHTCRVCVSHTNLIPMDVWNDLKTHPWLEKTVADIYQVDCIGQLKFAIQKMKYVECLELGKHSKDIISSRLWFPELKVVIFRQYSGFEEIILSTLNSHCETLTSVKFWGDDCNAYLNDEIVNELAKMPHLFHLSVGDVTAKTDHYPEYWSSKLQRITHLNVGMIRKWRYIKPLLILLSNLEKLHTGEIKHVFHSSSKVELPLLKELCISRIYNRPETGRVIPGMKLRVSNLQCIQVRTTLKFIAELFQLCQPGGTIECYLVNSYFNNEAVIREEAQKLTQAMNKRMGMEPTTMILYEPAIAVKDPNKYDPHWNELFEEHFGQLEHVQINRHRDGFYIPFDELCIEI